MSARAPSRRKAATARPPIDPAVFERVNSVIVELAGGDTDRREAAALLRENYLKFVDRVAGIANEQGRAFADEYRTAERYRLFHQLGATMTASKLREGLLRYQGANWPRDREKPNPYPDYDPRFVFYKILTLKDHVPSDGHMRAIFRLKGV